MLTFLRKCVDISAVISLVDETIYANMKKVKGVKCGEIKKAEGSRQKAEAAGNSGKANPESMGFFYITLCSIRVYGFLNKR